MGHNYNYMGQKFMVHNYIGHSYIGHNYVGHNYRRRCLFQLARSQPVYAHVTCMSAHMSTRRSASMPVRASAPTSEIPQPTPCPLPMGGAHSMTRHIVMAYIVVAHVVMAYLIMAYIVMAYIVMAHSTTRHVSTHDTMYTFLDTCSEGVCLCQRSSQLSSANAMHGVRRVYIGHRRRRVYRAGTDAPALKTTASTRALPAVTCSGMRGTDTSTQVSRHVSRKHGACSRQWSHDAPRPGLRRRATRRAASRPG